MDRKKKIEGLQIGHQDSGGFQEITDNAAKGWEGLKDYLKSPFKTQEEVDEEEKKKKQEGY